MWKWVRLKFPQNLTVISNLQAFISNSWRGSFGFLIDNAPHTSQSLELPARELQFHPADFQEYGCGEITKSYWSSLRCPAVSTPADPPVILHAVRRGGIFPFWLHSIHATRWNMIKVNTWKFFQQTKGPLLVPGRDNFSFVPRAPVKSREPRPLLLMCDRGYSTHMTRFLSPS